MHSKHIGSSIYRLRYGIALLTAISLLMACSDLRLNQQVLDGTILQQNERENVAVPEPILPTEQTDVSSNSSETTDPPTTDQPATDQPNTDRERLSDTVKIDAGVSQTCALTGSGAIYCWGGVWGTDSASAAKQVSGLPENAIDIAVGNYHACALTSGDEVLCWGHVQATTFSSSRVPSPVEVVPNLPSGIKEIAAGDGHTCALTSQGAVLCWDDGRFGQPMDGAVTTSAVPTDIISQNAFTNIESGFDHMCGITEQGGVQCWGDNQAGQLGNESLTSHNNAVQVVGLDRGVVALAVGFRQNCALLDDGQMKCWGKDNARGPGKPTIVNSNVALDFNGLEGEVESITLGDRHGCALLKHGGVKCWGYNYNGEVGDGTMTDRAAPVEVANLTSGVSAISAGGLHTCALMDDGHAKCWGGNHLGQLGNAQLQSSRTAVTVMGLERGAVDVVVGTTDACALTEQGGVKCWGRIFDKSRSADEGSAGEGAVGHQTGILVDIAGLSNGVTKIAGHNSDHFCALLEDGSVRCWGRNDEFQLGNVGKPGATPVDVVNLKEPVKDIYVGASMSCGLTFSNGLLCWGRHGGIQVDDESSDRAMTPIALEGLTSGIVDVSIGRQHACALTAEGGVKCWGGGLLGQGGVHGFVAPYGRYPEDVHGFSAEVVSVSVGATDACALTTEGKIFCWGYNGWMPLNTDSPRLHPSETYDFRQIAAGYGSLCMLRGSQNLECGGNRLQSGPKLEPGQSITALAVGDDSACLVTSGGAVQCWGSNTWGLLGSPNFERMPFPVDVMAGQ